MTDRKPRQIDEIELLLSRQGDDDLTPEEVETLAGLLQTETHRETADRYEQLDRMLGQLSSRSLPVDWDRFRLEVRRRIDAAERRRLAGPRLVRIFTPLAAAACVALVASLYWSALPERPARQRPAIALAQPVVEIAYRHPDETRMQAKARTFVVSFDRTPPSPDWKPVYDELNERPAIAMCGPDPARDNPATTRIPVF